MKRLFSGLGVYKDPNILHIALLGFASGLPLSLTLSTLTVWLTQAEVDVATIGLFAAIGTPYTLKFLWSHVVDHLPIPFLTRHFGKRRGWMLATQAGLMIAIFALGNTSPESHLMLTALLALTVTSLSATQDIAIDAYRVEILPEEQQGAGAAAIVFGYRIGMWTSGAGALYIAAFWGWPIAYMVMAPLLLIGVGAVLSGKEPKHPVMEEKTRGDSRIFSFFTLLMLIGSLFALWHFQEVLRPAMQFSVPIPGKEGPFLLAFGAFFFWVLLLAGAFITAGLLISCLTGISLKRSVVDPFAEFTHRPGWWVLLLFILLYKFGDAFAGVMTGPFIIKLGFSLEAYANIVKTFGIAATLLGAFLGGAMVKQCGVVQALWWCGWLQLFSNLMFVLQAEIGVHHSLLMGTIALENLSGGMGTTAFVAFVSQLCHKQFTATHYALLSAFAATGRTWLAASSGYVAAQVGWSGFFLFSTLLALPGVLMVLWVKRLPEKKPTPVEHHP